MVKVSRLLGVGAAVGLLGLAGTGDAQRVRTVTVKIHRVAQVDNLDKGDMLGSDKADFFCQITIDGKMHQTKQISDDDATPGWTFRAPMYGRTASVRIKLIDNDGGMEEKDDFVDINRRKGKKDLHLTYNPRTGRITGDARGRRGRIIRTQGSGDTDQGRIWFSIR